MTEKELVEKYISAKELFEKLEEEAKEAKKDFESIQIKLVEHLQLKSASKTAKYDGLGCISIMSPILGARSLNEEKLFQYLKETDRQDLIKATVHHKTLSAFVKEQLETGQEIPDFIEYWFKPSTRLTK